MSEEMWVPEQIALDKPNPARIYDYFLGGYHNFEVDRALARQLAEIFPDSGLAARANRSFLRRAVNHVMAQGIDQILDLGSGIPTVGNVHEVAQAVNPEAHVVYVDVDPVPVAHSLVMLKDDPRTAAIQADLRQPEVILKHEEVKALLDFGRPVAVLFVAVLHYILDDQVADAAMRGFREAMVPGSFVVITHSADEDAPAERSDLRRKLSSTRTTRSRTRGEIEALFTGFELVEPGLVHTPLWRPESPDDVLLDEPGRSFSLAGVGRKL